MPVLDAKALKTDPKGAAFLLGVLRRTPAADSKDTAKPSPTPRAGRRRTELIEDGLRGS